MIPSLIKIKMNLLSLFITNKSENTVSSYFDLNFSHNTFNLPFMVKTKLFTSFWTLKYEQIGVAQLGAYPP
jgi:hypothetical protein